MNARISLRCGRRTFYIDPEELVRIEAAGNYTEIFLSSGSKILVRDLLSAVASRLESAQFRRIERSHVVNILHVVEVRRETRRRFSVVLRDGTELPLGGSYKDDLEQALLL
jgi:two-component system, LytTR family, response regulator